MPIPNPPRVLGQDVGLPPVTGSPGGCGPGALSTPHTSPHLQAQALVQYLEEPLTQVAAS